MVWTDIGFGKYPDKTLPQVLLSDPDYFFWGIDSDAFAKRPYLANEAEMLDRRARSVKIPNNANSELEVEHVVLLTDNSYVRFDIESVDVPPHRGGSTGIRAPHLDFSVPRAYKQYDKSGYKQFIKGFKTHILANSTSRITKKLAEDFFSDANNFANP